MPEFTDPGGSTGTVAPGAGEGSFITPPTSPATPEGSTAVATARQASGTLDVIGSIPSLSVPQGNASLIRESDVAFRYLIQRMEGIDTKRPAAEIGELQSVLSKNLIPDGEGLRKRKRTTVVSGTEFTSWVGLTEVTGLREMTLQNCDDATEWTENADGSFDVATDTAHKAEGDAALSLTHAAGVGGGTMTVVHDLGAGFEKDLSQFDAVEFVVRGPATTSPLYLGISEDNVTYHEVAFEGTTDDAWVVRRLDLDLVSDAVIDAIRYLRFKVVGFAHGSEQVWYVDIIRAVRPVRHQLGAVRMAGTSTDGVRYAGTDTVTLHLYANDTGSWASKHVLEGVLANTKLRAVDWLGVTYMALGPAGNLKFENGIVSVWEEAPPSYFIALHYEKLFLLSQVYDRHGLRHSEVSSSTLWPLSAEPTGGHGGLIYVGRQHSYLPTGMRSAFGQLFIWTEGDLWILFGSDNQSFTLQRSHPGAGTTSHESVAVFDSGVIWYDGMGDRVLMWRGGQVYNIGIPVSEHIGTNTIPDARKPWVGATFDGRFYYLSYSRPGQLANDRMLVFDTELMRWSGPWEGPHSEFTCGLLGLDGISYVGTDTAEGIRAFSQSVSTDTYFGQAVTETVDTAWKSGAMNFRVPQWTKRMRRLTLLGDSVSGASFTANFYRDQESSAVRSYGMVLPAGNGQRISRFVDLEVSGDTMQIELTESSTVDDWLLTGVMLDGALIRPLR